MTSSGSSTPISPPSSGTPNDQPSLTSSLLRARPYRFATLAATVDSPDPSHRDQHGSSSVPIYQTATFKGMGGQYDYTRSGNPTRSHLEHHIAKISSARHAFAVTSGMGALDVIFRLLKPGDNIIAGNDLYGGSNRLIGYLKEHNGITTHHVDTTKAKSLLPLLQDPDVRVAMVLLETPTNPLLQIADIEEIAKLVKRYKKDAIVVVDNTMLSPYLQRPLELGADVVYDSGTKYLSGHHDLMAGVITCDRDDIAKGIAFTINSIGNALSPFDSFLLLRGVKTLPLRIDKQQANCQRLAEYLDALGFKVNYPGLPGFPGKEIHDRLASGPGAVLSFETGDVALSEKIVGGTRLWGISVSFGCINSLISMPCLMSHASIDPAVRAARNLPEDLIRLCVGIEDVDDLLDDLEASLLESGAVRVVDEAGDRKVLERAGGKRENVTELANRMKEVEITAGKAKIEKLITSAPGKVILFGEHAVVHGVTAIAGAIDLRCYCLATSRSDSLLSLNLPDLGYSQTWPISSLPWTSVTPSLLSLSGKPPRSDTVPDQELLTLLANKFVKRDQIKAVQAAQAFLYLYMHLSGGKEETAPAQTYTVRSALPISAGLGSSAAYSVSVASSLLYTHGVLPLPSSAPSSSDNDDVVPSAHAESVNAWAFLAEKVIHGTPSGVDNTVATLGGALAFRKAITGKQDGSLEVLRGVREVRFLLTDTKVPRDTKTLVEGVARRKLQEPDTINPLLTSIQRISDSAHLILTSSTLSRSDQLSQLSTLVEQNHTHLVSLGVGHAALEAVRSKTREEPWGLKTKLTGAGGGGCAVTIIPDDFSDASLLSLRSALADSGFETYSTTLGGAGFGLLIDEKVGSEEETAEGGVEASAVPDAKRFEEQPAEGLAEWASGAGRWVCA